MKKTAVFQTALAEIIEVPNDGADAKNNPYLTLAKFIFADDKGNDNYQGIEFEDFDEVIATAIDMPVKMNFTGEGVANHSGSYVIGHIKTMDKVKADDGTNQLLAAAVLYAEEYPEEVEFLKKSHAAGEAPGISYEIAYSDTKVKNGVQWLKNLITCAATFVRTPAYGKRTALLALASAKDDAEFFQTMRTFIAQAEDTSGEGTDDPKNKGGINVDELEKVKQELDALKAEASTKTAEITRLTEALTEKDNSITELTTKVAELENGIKLEARVRKMSEAGFTLEADAEKAEKKKSFWLSFSDESFDEYVADLVAAKASVKPNTTTVAQASLRNTDIPRLEVPEANGDIPSFRLRD